MGSKHGFSLFEVLIALAIFSTSALGILYLNYTIDHLNLKTFSKEKHINKASNFIEKFSVKNLAYKTYYNGTQSINNFLIIKGGKLVLNYKVYESKNNDIKFVCGHE